MFTWINNRIGDNFALEIKLFMKSSCFVRVCVLQEKPSQRATECDLKFQDGTVMLTKRNTNYNF